MKSIQRIATTKNIFILFLLFISSYLFLNTFRHPVSILSIQEMSGGNTILNLLPYYDYETAYEYLFSYSPKAIIYYYRVLIFDILVLIPIYVTFFSSGLIYFLKRLTKLNISVIKKIALLPLVAGIINLTEDVVVAIMLRSLPNTLTEVATFAGILTTFKSVIITTSLLSVILMFIVIVVKSGIKMIKDVSYNN